MIFAQPRQPPDRQCDRFILSLFAAFFVCGAILRGLVCFTTVGRVHPDEHQQYLEQAHRYAYGYGCTFWEQEHRVRNPLYPALLSLPLASMRELDVEDPLIRAGVVRLIIALALFACCARFAWEFHRRGNTAAALILMATLSLSADVVYADSHPLSENAASIPILLALVWLQSRPFSAGLLLGLSFALRFQSGILIAVICFLSWSGNRFRFSREVNRLAIGLALSLFAVGLGDLIMHGGWFYSPIAYVRINFVHGTADFCGVHPWYQYLLWIGGDRWLGFAFMLILFTVGAIREWRLALLLAVYVAVHSVIRHKEARFLLPVAPIALALMGVGIARLLRPLIEKYPALLIAAGVGALTVLSSIRAGFVEWEQDPYRPSALLLREAGMQPDLTGVAQYGPNFNDSGNYFYLSRNVPLVSHYDGEIEALLRREELLDGRINYLICKTIDIRLFQKWTPVPIREHHGFALYRLTTGQANSR